MDTWQRHQHIFRLINRTISHPICQKFNMTHEDLHVDGPILLVPNHASAWDPCWSPPVCGTSRSTMSPASISSVSVLFPM